MDPIKDLYKNTIREEILNPEVQNAKEAFFLKHFETEPASSPSPWAFLFSPSFRLALVGCLALLVLVKTGAFETVSQNPADLLRPEPKPIQAMPAETTKATEMIAAVSSPAQAVHKNHIEIKKLGSQMGSTVAYQKNFSDVQLTVIWVFPKGA